VLFTAINGSNLASQPSWTPSTGTWYYVVCAFDVDTTNAVIYVNGSSIGTQTGGAAPLDGGTFYCGTRSGGDAGFMDGLLDECGLWNKTLTSDEVTSLYNSGNGLAYPFTTTSATHFLSLLGVGT